MAGQRMDLSSLLNCDISILQFLHTSTSRNIEEKGGNASLNLIREYMLLIIISPGRF
jgi:hypothetical protein